MNDIENNSRMTNIAVSVCKKYNGVEMIHQCMYISIFNLEKVWRLRIVRYILFIHFNVWLYF